MQKGIIILFTGAGKGKTTAALGTAIRAVGQNLKVCIIQFIKHPGRPGGEHKVFKKYFPSVEFHTLGGGFIRSRHKLAGHRKKAQQALDAARQKIFSGNYDLIVLDELTYLISLNLLSEEEVLAVLKQKPPHVHLLITGRGAVPSLIEISDLVTEYKEIKHPFHKGQKALKGIDY